MTCKTVPVRSISPLAWKVFIVWTVFFWIVWVPLWACLFFIGILDFPQSTKGSLYGVSVWLNGCFFAFITGRKQSLSKLDTYHDCLALWSITYCMTNLLWELPWVLVSRSVFQNLNTLEDVVNQSNYMRSSIFNMWYWVLASFASVDLRTVNHDGTFYSLEIFCFANIASTLLFFYLNSQRHPNRYLVPLAFGGVPVAATFIFSFAEVFNHFKNMPGGFADILLALVWTQYQYLLFPIFMGIISVPLLQHDWIVGLKKIS